jgi:hypothetical protein
MPKGMGYPKGHKKGKKGGGMKQMPYKEDKKGKKQRPYPKKKK